MTSKLKCPFCLTELEQMHDKKMFGCSKCLHIADGAFWKKVIQAKQDLETAKADIEDYKKYKALWEQIRNNTILELERKLKIARKALKEVLQDESDEWFYIAKNALEQIEHKK